MYKSIVAVIFGLIFLTRAPATGTFVVWVAEDFVRADGAPVTVTRTFTVIDPAPSYTLHLYNGGRNGQFSRSTSAVITLNGNQVVDPSDFNQDIAFIEKEVPLLADNTFTVEMRGQPGSGIAIEFLGIDNTAPEIVASVNPPPNASGWNNTDVTVTFVCSDSTSGIATCPEPVVISTDTAGEVITRTATDQAGNAATTSVTVKLDKTPPAVTSSRTPEPNTNGWNKADVTAHFGATDTLSGIQGDAFFDVTLASEGSGQSAAHTFTDLAGNAATGTISNINIDKTPPIVAITSPAAGATLPGAALTVTGTATDSLSGIAALRCNTVPVTPLQSPFSCNLNLNLGSNQIVVEATDTAGNVQTATETVSYLPPPIILSLTPDNGQQGQTNLSVVIGSQFTNFVNGTTTVSFSGSGITVNGVTVADATHATANVSIAANAALGARSVTVTTSSEVVTRSNAFTVTAATVITPGLPPDPASVAPPLRLTELTSFSSATEFLYKGANAIQTGVPAGAIEPIRAAVVRGKAITRDGASLSGVKITILNHPEWGQTLSRTDGKFDMAVNGGGPLVVNYDKGGFLPAQRQVDVAWQDFAQAPDVALIAYDTQATAIDLSTPPGGMLAPAQFARGSVITDSDGQRQPTLLFPQGTMASMVMPDGSTTPLLRLTVRATEYTVGPNGPQAMPAALPPTSAYTYALELSADEAVAAHAREVQFNTPLPFYVDNFIGFPVGTTVPLGSYDGTRGTWVPAESGRVIKILSVTGGVADLDVTGDNVADSGAALAALAITDAERQHIATAYTSGQTLWRVRIPHFSAWDINWGIAPPDGARGSEFDPEPNKPTECQSQESGSIIGCQNQTLGEAVPVAGTPFGLHYESDRTPGYKSAFVIDIPLSGAQLPSTLKRIDLVISVAGQVHTSSFSAVPNQRITFTWDGKDVYGRTLQGTQRITVRIGYMYDAVYAKTSRFGYNGGGSITGVRSRREVTLWRTWEGGIGTWDARGVGLGGWTLTAHHTFDPIGKSLYRGDGKRQSALDLGPVITTVAGGVDGGQVGCDAFGDGRPATQAEVCPRGLAVAPDGSIYISDTGLRIRRVAPDGIITTVAGTGVPGFSGDGGPATQAKFHNAYSIALGPDTSLYISDSENRRVRRVGLDGIITTVAGNGTSCPVTVCGDGGPATLASISVGAIAVGPDGSLYINTGRRIRRVGPDGIISTVAGTSGFCVSIQFGILTDPCGDGGLATSAPVNAVSIAVGPDGSLYFSDGDLNRVRRVGPDGIIRTIAGTGTLGFSGDGGPATQATFRGIDGIALGGGSLLVVDGGNRRIRWMRLDGAINTLAGNGDQTFSGDGGLAAQAGLENTQAYDSPLALGPDGSVYVGLPGFFGPYRVRRISLAIPGLGFDGSGLAAAADGSELYVLAVDGRHLRTLDALTAAVQLEFGYDTAGRLSSVTDSDGNVTTIEHDSSGRATAIVAPFGQRTALTINADGYLERIGGPTGETVSVAYATAGLLTDFTNPRNNVSRYVYDALGRLIRATDPSGASQTLTRVGTNRDYTVTQTSPLGQTITYRTEYLLTGDVRRTTTSPEGQVQRVTAINGTESAILPDSTTINFVFGRDPRWGMQSPVIASMTVRTPGGRVFTRTTQRNATVTNPANLLSLNSLTETMTMNGLVETISYNATSRTITHISPAGRRDTLVLDAQGRSLQFQYADLNPSAFTYDSRGRLSTSTWGAGASSRVTQGGYDGNGYLASIVDPLNRTTSFISDATGRVTEESLPGGLTARVNYDANSNVTSVTPPGKLAHAFDYTNRNETSSYRPPMVGTENSQIGFVYDQDGRLLRIERPADTIGFSYDSAGRLQRLQLPSSFRDYGYDAVGRLTSLSTSGGIALGYSYDGGLTTGTTWSGAVSGSVTRAFDNNFRVISHAVNGTNPITIVYDNDRKFIQSGALTMTRHAQTGLITATTLGQITDATTYDGFGAVASYTANRNGSTIYAVTYGRDALGRIISRNEAINGTARALLYAYDAAGRVREVRQDGVVAAMYDYDANGNRITMTGSAGAIVATFDAQDRLTRYGSTTYVHAANGDLRSKASGSVTTAYRYDGLTTLTGVTLSDGKQIDYLLDGEGRRVGKMINGVLMQGWLYQDALRPIAELDAAGSVRTRFVYGDSGNVPAYMIKGGNTYRIIVDHLGSPRLVIDVATGAIAQELAYDAFGIVVRDTQPGFQPFGFAGGLYDADTKLVRFGARDYDAETGRWISKDGGGFSGGLNLYAYADNDPVNLIDPLGDNPTEPPPGVSKAVWERLEARAAAAKAARAANTAGRYGTRAARAARTVEATQSAVVQRGLMNGVKPGFATVGAMGSMVAVTVAFEAGYWFGNKLNEWFCLTDKISDFLMDWWELDPTTEHAFQQFMDNRGGSIGLKDIVDFNNRCNGGSMSAFCTGYAAQ